MGVGGLRFSGKKRYEGVRFNVISVTRGWVGVQFPQKKRYVTLEWPLILFMKLWYLRLLQTTLIRPGLRGYSSVFPRGGGGGGRGQISRLEKQALGAIQVLRNADGGGGYQIFRKKALRRCNVQCY